MSNVNPNIYTTQQNIQNYQQTAQAVGEAAKITAEEVVEVATGLAKVVEACMPLFSSCCKKTDKTVKPEFEITQAKEAPVMLQNAKVENKPLSTRDNIIVVDKK